MIEDNIQKAADEYAGCLSIDRMLEGVRTNDISDNVRRAGFVAGARFVLEMLGISEEKEDKV